MRIQLTSIMVNDQAHALDFYTRVLGFRKLQDFPAGAFRWITVVSSDEENALELALEPNENPDGKRFQQALYDQGIPATAFFSNEIEVECARLKAAGVNFFTELRNADWGRYAVFDDTCGNLISLNEG